jgi:hypothetical protein
VLLTGLYCVVTHVVSPRSTRCVWVTCSKKDLFNKVVDS